MLASATGNTQMVFENYTDGPYWRYLLLRVVKLSYSISIRSNIFS
jgi:hypothetical protein